MPPRLGTLDDAFLRREREEEGPGVVVPCGSLPAVLRNGTRNLNHENVARVRKLRSDASASEKVLWEFLRKRRLGGFLFRRQHPVGLYALDFYCAEAKVCVEVDGE